MMKGRILLMLAALAVLVALPAEVMAKDSYMTAFNNKYATKGTKIGVCKVCHTAVPSLNPYGSDFRSAHSGGTTVGQALGMIKSLDSDGDGFTNIAEIRKRTWPGKATSHP